jgi:thiamine kinase-like enzyme
MPEQPATGAGPEAEEAGLRALLARLPATRTIADGRLTRLEGGLSNRAWRLDDAREASWFVRLGHPDAARLGVDRASECLVLGAVSRAGIAPEVVACEPAAGLLVTRFVAGRPWQGDDVHRAGNLRRVAERLRCLHSLAVPPGVVEVSYARQARRLAAGLPEPTDREAMLHDRAGRVFALLGAHSRAPALCHNDLHHLNMLDDGRLWLVDWEYGGRGDPLFDLAGFLALHELGPAATAAFLASYGDLPAADLAVLDAARWAFDYVQWLWYRRRFPAAAGAEDGPAARLAQRLLHCDNWSVAWDHG